MSISKITLAWTKLAESGDLDNTFGDAWAGCIRALSGSWGTINHNLVQGDPVTEMQYRVTQGYFYARSLLTFTGPVTLTLPVDHSGPATILLKKVESGLVAETMEYILGEGEQSVNASPPSGTYLVTVQGTARRL